MARPRAMMGVVMISTLFMVAAFEALPDPVQTIGDDCTAHPFHVLVTGFGPFLQFTHNPTEDIVASLQDIGCEDVEIVPVANSKRARLRVCWHAYLLPVNETGALWTTQHLQDKLSMVDHGVVPYDAILHTGLEDLAKGLKLEVIASNVRANVEGRTDAAIPEAPGLLPTTVNTGWFALSTIAAAAPPRDLLSEVELWSRDAGTFYCNEVYFRTLNLIRLQKLRAANSGGALLPAMFLHVPDPNRSSVRGDVDMVRQVVGHALWGTYLVPDERQTFGLDAPQCPVDLQAFAGPSAWSFVSGALTAIAPSAIIVLWFTARARVTHENLREPMLRI